MHWVASNSVLTTAGCCLALLGANGAAETHLLQAPHMQLEGTNKKGPHIPAHNDAAAGDSSSDPSGTGM